MCYKMTIPLPTFLGGSSELSSVGRLTVSESKTHCVPPVTYIGTSILLWTHKACVIR